MTNFLYALKQVFKPSFINFIKIFSLSIGLLISGIIACRTAFYNSYDKFLPEYENINFLLLDWGSAWGSDQGSNFSAKATGAMAGEIADKIPSIKKATRFYEYGNNLKFGERDYHVRMALGDTLFFDVLAYEVLAGDPKLALSDPFKIMVSKKFADRVFGEDSPIGKGLTNANGAFLEVAGVFEIPENSFLSDLDILSTSEGRIKNSFEQFDAFYTFFITDKNVNRQELDLQINEVLTPHLSSLAEKGTKITFYSKALEDFYKYEGEGGTEVTSGIISILGVFILMVTCFNFALIQINSLISRAKLVGVHKTNGASKGEIFSMVIWETIIYVLVSLALAIALLFLARGPIESIMGSFEDILALEHLWAVGLLLILVVIIAGLLPAYIYSNIPAMQVFRKFTGNNLWWKQILLTIQFVLSISMVIGLICVSLQYRFLIKFDLGYSTENLYAETFKIDAENISRVSSLKEELLQLPFVEKATYSDMLIIWGLNGHAILGSEDKEQKISAREIAVDEDFFDTYQINVLYGDTKSLNNENIFVTENLLEFTGSSYGDYNFITEFGDVAGVVSDVRNNLYIGKAPFVFKPVVVESTGHYRTITIRSTHKLNKEEMTRLNETLRTNVGEDYYFRSFKSAILGMYSELGVVKNAFLLSGIILILITILGIMSYIGTEIKARTREIAIRRTHGAGIASIIFFVARRIIIVALLASAIAVPASFFGIRQLFSMYFSEQVTLSWWIFAAGVLSILLLIAVITYVQTYKIARRDYVKLIGKI